MGSPTVKAHYKIDTGSQIIERAAFVPAGAQSGLLPAHAFCPSAYAKVETQDLEVFPNVVNKYWRIVDWFPVLTPCIVKTLKKNGIHPQGGQPLNPAKPYVTSKHDCWISRCQWSNQKAVGYSLMLFRVPRSKICLYFEDKFYDESGKFEAGLERTVFYDGTLWKRQFENDTLKSWTIELPSGTLIVHGNVGGKIDIDGGTIVFADGRRFEGQWELQKVPITDGCQCYEYNLKEGKITYKDGRVQEGKITGITVGPKLIGKEMMDKVAYTGRLKRKVILMFGSSVYEGQIDQQGLQHGEGVLYHLDGRIFVGTFVHGQQGEGMSYTPDTI